MKIIAIDPGYDRLGIAVLEKDPKGKEYLVYSECLQTSPRDNFNDRLGVLGKRVREVILEYNPTYMAIENLFFAKNTKTALKVSESRGAVIFQAIDNNIPVYEFTPNQIKVAVTGYGKATKKDVYLMTSKLISLHQKKYIDDEIDAIATGLTFFATHNQKTLERI